MDRICSGFLLDAQIIVWQAQIPYPKDGYEDEDDDEDEDEIDDKYYNRRVLTVFNVVGHADQVPNK